MKLIAMKQYTRTRVYISACIGMMFFGVSFIVMGAVLPAMAAKYHLTEVGSSLLVTFLPVGLLIGSLLFGPIVDRFGYKSLLCVSSATIIGGLLGLSFFDNLNLFRIAIFFIGLGGGVLNGATNSLVAEIYDGKQAASRLSILGMCYGIGALVIPLLLSFFSKRYSYETILFWTSFVIFLSVIYFASIKFPEPKNKQGFPIKDAIRLIKEPALLTMGFILFFQSGLEGLLNNWSTTYLMNASISDKDALLALTALVLGITLGRLVLGYLITRLNLRHILIGGLVLLIIGITVMNYADTFWVGATALFVIGVGLAGVFPIIIGTIGSMYKEMTGTAISIALFIALNGNSILNYLMGHVSARYTINFFPKFLLLCVGLQIVVIIIGRKYFNNSK